MAGLLILSAAEQAAAHLRAELLRGRWSGLIPGGDRLAADLEIGGNTVEAALRQLEEEGLLINQGRRRGRLINLPEGGITKAALRVAILVPEISDLSDDYIYPIRHALEKAGHETLIPGKTMHDLKLDLGRLARLVQQTAADAWMVGAGAREVLEWFSVREVPAFALFGRRSGVPIAGAGPNHMTPYMITCIAIIPRETC